MSFTAAQIAEQLRGEVLGDSSVQLTGLAPADCARVGDLTFAENMVPNRALGMLFFFDVHHGISGIVQPRGPFAFDRFIYIVRDPMKFLRSDDKIEVWYFVQKR